MSEVFDFRTVAAALAPYINGSWEVIHATDAVLAALKERLDATTTIVEMREPEPYTHNRLVEVAENNIMILQFVSDKQKIQAIKELRAATGCSLREAKAVIEDPSVETAAALQRLREKLTGEGPDYTDPWSEENPF